jgi:nitric oxide reductase subunit B
MGNGDKVNERLSPWWRRSVFLVLGVGFGVLIWLTVKTYQDAPPIPEKVITSSRNEGLFC